MLVSSLRSAWAAWLRPSPRNTPAGERSSGGLRHSEEDLGASASWERDGVLFLRHILTENEINAVRRAVDREWDQPIGNDHAVDMLTGSWAGTSFRMYEAPPEARVDAYKLNNLFARTEVIRGAAHSPKLKEVITALLGGEPLICNSLNFERGSQQAFHVDSWYMPPPVEGKMVAASISLDGVDSDNGPIVYYPASHKIPPYRFSDGRVNEIPAESALCQAYLDNEIAARGLAPVEAHASRGDVFLWDGQLLHGGAPIRNFARTRASLVVHYWRVEDVPPEHVRRDEHGAYLAHTLRGEIRF